MTRHLSTLRDTTLEGICRIMADTFNGLTGAEIKRELIKVGIADIDSFNTKWVRLFNAFVNYQNTRQCANAILNFCKNYFQPNRFIVNETLLFREQLNAFNKIMAFEGWHINESGILQKTSKYSTISEVEDRFNTLKAELTNRNCHQQVFRYCITELLAENYFHSVEEAIKGLFDRIKELAALQSGDGATLVDEVFSTKNGPILIINNFQTDTELTAHKGFMCMLKGLYSLCRSPRCHTSKIKWESDKQDSLDIFSMVSYCHRILDNAQKIK